MRKWGLIAFFALITAFAFGQTAEVLDRVLETEALTFAQASRLVMGAAGTMSPDLSDEDCFAAAQERGWVPSEADLSQEIRLDEYSHLSMAAFGLRGGFLYRFFPGPRYGYREFVYKKLIQGRVDPSQKVSGVRAVRIIGRVLDAVGESL